MITAIIFIICLVIWGVICFCAELKESDCYWKPVVNRLQNELGSRKTDNEKRKKEENKSRAQYAIKLANIEEARKRNRLPPLRFGDNPKKIIVNISHRETTIMLNAAYKKNARRDELKKYKENIK